jgi:hypothetical protein
VFQRKPGAGSRPPRMLPTWPASRMRTVENRSPDFGIALDEAFEVAELDLVGSGDTNVAEMFERVDGIEFADLR